MKLKVVISGGGTGGHIFPALSIANELKQTVPDVEILFVGALGKMEMERVPAAGYPIVGLPVMGLPRKASLRLFKFLWMLFKSMQKARKVIKDFQPDVAIGVGGFASGPVLKAAVRAGVPAILQEQNSYAGVTNKLLSAKVRKICVAYPNMERYFPAEKLVVTGNPVRQNLLQPVDRSKALQAYNLSGDKPIVFVVGGSLGARSLNESVMANLDYIAKSDVQVVWQTGKIYYREMLERLNGKQPANLQALEFLTDMDLAYKAADLVISRAGAGTISELCLLGKPSVLMPSPNVAEDHQTKNAMALVEQNAAVLVKDADGPERLFKEAFQLVSDKDKLASLAKNSKKLAKPNATAEIVQVILNEVKK
ncbi:undecaprenyldiphospho-muramoylpentapeptide beta-N-acetylglucosaminyltransferase [Mangrovibacterium lignilyticum]|uniref:undecaprenyldiphospho-muramoylpentapeptide beta-N-acetylglucosaminyltransferase n=1 Tax=Mangrovibacterium lignilyticum TaxID=2668052 RepID=UPI0013D731E2|nr:undecaprenyldiphospho-muramoylpentapeptide beta-N-acetylglucosaminyltransferase [Mangrovibacterium lignilyticum]